MPISVRTTDILILGSGLSGLRAAWAASENGPDCSITVAGMRSGPTGSSFTNRNDALGMQLLDTDERRQRFVHEAVALARPGRMDKRLAEIMAEESEPRFREMEAMGVKLRRNEAGHLARFPGCGGPDPRAVIFEDLQSLFNRFSKKTNDYENIESINLETLGLLKHEGAICGAWGRSPTDGELIAVRTKVVIMALGGPAPLFAGHIAGSANPGFSYGLMTEVGAVLANTPYLQFMWGLEDKTFRNPAALLGPGARILPEDGPPIEAADSLGERHTTLCSARALHCPAFYHRPQTAMDRLLLTHRRADGLVRVERDGRQEKVGLYAHAGNGGAVVDSYGATSVPGLLAVGECATGMHGVNRMGGAMILATQVFGRRAGMSAAGYATGVPHASETAFSRLCRPLPEQAAHLGTEPEALQAVRTGLDAHAVFGGLPGLEAFREQLQENAMSQDRLVRLAALSGLEITRPLIGTEGQ